MEITLPTGERALTVPEQPLQRLMRCQAWNSTSLPLELRPLAEAALKEATERLDPPTAPEFAAEMGSCLALVSGVGMSRDDRNEWIQAAAIALQGIPADLLRAGCAEARLKADHPSKIVPTIERAVRYQWDRRREDKGHVMKLLYPPVAKTQPTPKEDLCTAEQAAEIIKQAGIDLSVAGDKRDSYRGSEEIRKQISGITPSGIAA